MLTDQEKNELKFYKKRNYAYFGALALQIFIIAPLLYIYMDNRMRDLFLLIYGVTISMSFISEFILYFYRDRAFAINLSLFNAIFLLGFHTFVGFSFAILNKLIKDINFWYLGSIFLLSFILAQFLEVKLWGNRVKFMINNEILEIENNRYDFLRERDYYKGKYTVWHGYSFLMIVLGLVYFVIRQFYFIRWYDFKQLAGGIISVLLGIIVINYFSRLFSRGFLFLKLEKEKKTKIYTNLMKYIRMEDEINEWRKGKGLKPVKIKSFFFNGDIEK